MGRGRMLSNDDGSLLQIGINFIRKDCDTIAPAISEPPMVHVCPQPAHCPPLQHCTAHLAGPWGACRARNWICPLDDIKELTVKTEMESLAACYLGSGPTRRIWSLPANQCATNTILRPEYHFLIQIESSLEQKQGVGQGAAYCWSGVVLPEITCLWTI